MSKYSRFWYVKMVVLMALVLAALLCGCAMAAMDTLQLLLAGQLF
jgi:hypothetical protein